MGSLSLGPVRLYVWAAVKNGAQYLYAQLYAGWRRRKTVYLGKDVGEVAGRIVAATAELGCAAQWSEAEKLARRLLRELAAVREVYRRLREWARWERGLKASLLYYAYSLLSAAVDLSLAEEAEEEPDPHDVQQRVEAAASVLNELYGELEVLRR